MQIDEYASQFKRAHKAQYEFERIAIARACAVVAEPEVLPSVKSMVPPNSDAAHTQILWDTILARDAGAPGALVERLQSASYDLVVIERDLDGGGEQLLYGLSNLVDAVTQALEIPVLLLPRRLNGALSPKVKNPENVLLESAHLTGDSRIINWAVRFTEPVDHLFLAHIEDDKTFKLYAEAIEKIPEIDSETAVAKLEQQLLKMPEEFIAHVTEVLGEQVPGITVNSAVQFGHSVTDYRALIAEHGIDMLVLEADSPEQLAMNSSAYALAVEVKDIPIALI